MVDSPGRDVPRFPPDQVDRVTREVHAGFDRWQVGPGTTLVCGGARGADIIAAEAASARGARVLLRLALPPATLERRSVELPGTDWVARFRRLLAIADVEVLPEQAAGDGDGDDVFALANDWMIGVARDLSVEPPHTLVVWDGKSGDGPGGTADFVRRLGHRGPGPQIMVIDPTRRAYEERQAPDGQKKVLALDGGGIRGALAIEVLATIESQLRQRYGDKLVLADYFDYIGGTSTGAVIAAALAMGSPVGQLREAYETLGRKVFRKCFFPKRLRSLYRDGPLTEVLDDMLGDGRTLGDPALRCLLMVVLHNTVTDSPWLLSNCTQAKYNRADRCLNRPPDRNLDLSLTQVVRGCTAAPLYFPPQEMMVGARPFLFQDGGITPFNNPALILFLMATLPEYGLGWPVGDDRLLIVSVGTGSSTAVHPGLLAKQVRLLFTLRNLPAVFMNGTAVSQDLLCRALGRCVTGAPIDREVGDRIGAEGVGNRSLFTYVRYDADLSAESLSDEGISDPRQQRRLRKLDAVGSLPELQELGQRVAQGVRLDEHFHGFLPTPART